jgi:RimJ/RimL family protein N-acetyltransferase
MLFETERLVVRRAILDDVEALLTFFADPEHTRYFGSGQPLDRREMGAYLGGYPEHDPRLISLPGLALLKPELCVVGFGGVGYYAAPENHADLLFILKKEFWGKGLATELARAALAKAFERPEITMIYATAKPGNAAAIRVLEKCGMLYEQYLSDRDRVLYRIGRSDTSAFRPLPFHSTL